MFEPEAIISLLSILLISLLIVDFSEAYCLVVGHWLRRICIDRLWLDQKSHGQRSPLCPPSYIFVCVCVCVCVCGDSSNSPTHLRRVEQQQQQPPVDSSSAVSSCVFSACLALFVMRHVYSQHVCVPAEQMLAVLSLVCFLKKTKKKQRKWSTELT